MWAPILWRCPARLVGRSRDSGGGIDSRRLFRFTASPPRALPGAARVFDADEARRVGSRERKGTRLEARSELAPSHEKPRRAPDVAAHKPPAPTRSPKRAIARRTLAGSTGRVRRSTVSVPRVPAAGASGAASAFDGVEARRAVARARGGRRGRRDARQSLVSSGRATLSRVTSRTRANRAGARRRATESPGAPTLRAPTLRLTSPPPAG